MRKVHGVRGHRSTPTPRIPWSAHTWPPYGAFARTPLFLEKSGKALPNNFCCTRGFVMRTLKFSFWAGKGLRPHLCPSWGLCPQPSIQVLGGLAPLAPMHLSATCIGGVSLQKSRFREAMIPALSIVGFAPSGSYYSPLCQKPLFWTS